MTAETTHPALPEYVKLVLAPNPGPMTGPGTNSFLVGGSAGARGAAESAGTRWQPASDQRERECGNPVPARAAPRSGPQAPAPEGAAGCYIIDPGPEEPGHLETLAREGQARGGVRGILITHGHADHYEGAQTLARLTGAPILAWSREGTSVADEVLADQQVIDCGLDWLRVIHTPGHRFDHVCLLLEDARILFAGDLVAGVGTVVIVPPEGSINEYLRSLRRLLALDLALILPAHGPLVAAPRAKLQEYIDHRLLREQQILAALQAGLDRIPAMVQRIYADVDPRLHGFAGESVRAHLLKLEEEGRVAQREVGGEIIWRLT